ncbi:MAG TPA: hypothetical protein DEW32_11520 [Dehalococcoidia bacterium]|nr:hypothetical protein [Dehalococcoidia bacterium]
MHLPAKLDTPVAKFLIAGVANKNLSVVLHVSRHCENLSTPGVRVQRQVDNLYDETRSLLPQRICKRQSLLAAPAPVTMKILRTLIAVFTPFLML